MKIPQLFSLGHRQDTSNYIALSAVILTTLSPLSVLGQSNSGNPLDFDTQLQLTNAGADGANGFQSGGFLGIDPNDNPAVRGGDGQDLTGASINGSPYISAFIQSSGGKGGNGIPDDGDTDVIFGGADGGNGGAISLTVSNLPAIGATSDIGFFGLGSPAGLFQLISLGGTGGDGSDGSVPGNGGNAGSVTITINDGVTYAGPSLDAAILLQSTAGDTGGNSSNAFDGFVATAGSAGNISFTLNPNSTISITFPNFSVNEDFDIINQTYGVRLESIGGDGAAGGALGSQQIVDANEGGFTLFPGFPGDGNKAGSAGNITITLDGQVTVSGTQTTAISALSQGGNGGDGGADFSTSDGNPGGGAMGEIPGAIQMTIGSNGGVSTTSTQQAAIELNAFGGNGGDGGFTNSGKFTSNGGFAGAGGDAIPLDGGNSIEFTNNGGISTLGALSPAVILQSVGGDGGTGTLLGDGGDGGKGGDILANQNGTVVTSGDYAFGLVVQSIGGLGGDGGQGGFVGGNGGAGGTGGNLTINNVGTIATQGTGAVALLAQSVGGGGLQNSLTLLNYTQVESPSTTGGGDGGGASLFGRGGNGGAGGSAGSIILSSGNSITTAGSNAAGIYAQSLGGGGGLGGNESSTSLGINVGRGGAGGTGGQAGDITITLAPTLNENGNVIATSNIQTSGLTSPGIVAHSIGGSGGNGGSADTSAYSVGFALDVAIGGGGGSGNTGGAITIDHTGSISTMSVDSHGIEAFSIGGSGGAGGQASSESNAVGTPQIPTVSISSSVGGKGGSGGNGGVISLSHTGSIVTKDDQSMGIYASSIGGGGGNGGNATALATSTLKAKEVNIAIGTGGTGGAGGDGGSVDVKSTSGSITTSGLHSHGIFLASVGGGGGNGGIGTGTTDASTLAEQSIGIALSLGGNGGATGDGNAVTIAESAASITTSGDDSAAIFVQSIGGGGGSNYLGGVTATSGTASSDDAIQAIAAQPLGSGGSADSSGDTDGSRVNVGVGGNGSGGGDGGEANITTLAASDLQTSGDGSHGIHAMSIGGGGGSGGGASTSKAEAGEVQETTEKVLSDSKVIYNNTDSILKILKGLGSTATTVGGYVLAANAQIRSTLGLTDTEDQVAGEEGEEEAEVTASLNVSLGGSGGIGGAGGDVTIESASTITTGGDTAHGIFAQSIGGGGGNGGTGASSGGTQLNLGSSIGGDGGGGTHGGTVDVTNTGSITTGGDHSHGIWAMSIGGGGGVATHATSTDSGSLSSITDLADGKYKSIAANLDIGGDQGNGGTGGKVTVTNSKSISTSGSEAHGIHATSIGGGGGAHTLNLDGALSTFGSDSSDASGSDSTSGNSDDSGDSDDDAGDSGKSLVGIQTSIGGKGGNGAAGGDVTINNDGTVSTTGNYGHAVFAQSVGGGGGTASGLASPGTGAFLLIAPQFASSGGTGNHGGAVTFTAGQGSSLSTTGTGATALFAQSVGGGGGYAGAIPENSIDTSDPLFFTKGFTVPANFNGTDGSSGDGGAITIQMAKDAASTSITTTGAGAHGIYAQSIGGGGGTYTGEDGLLVPEDVSDNKSVSSGSVGGNITIDWRGPISTTGDNSVAVFAQSGTQTTDGSVLRNVNNGSIVITLHGDVTGGNADGAAIRIDGGSRNQIEYSGGTLTAASGIAILETNAALAKNNQTIIGNGSTIIGNVFTSTVTTFINRNGAIFHPGNTVDLALSESMQFGRSTFQNASGGTLDVGGPGVVERSDFNSDFDNQGTWNVDVDLANGRSDGINVAGSATIDGTVNVNFISEYEEAVSPMIILTTGSGYELSANLNAPLAFQFLEDFNSLSLDVEFISDRVESELPDLTQNEIAAGKALQNLWDNGDLQGTDDHVGSLLGITSPQAYQAALQDLAPESHAVVGATAPHQASKMQNSLHSFPVFVGDTAQLGETSGVYTKYTFTYLRHSSDGQISAYNQWDNAFQINGQVEPVKDWFIGGTFIYNFSTIQADDGQSSGAGDSFFFGAIAKKILFENLLLSGSIGYAFGIFDQERDVIESGRQRTAQADQYVHTLSSRIRASYNVDLGKWYLRPGVALDLVYVNIPSYSETGAGALNMEFNSADDFQVGITPDLEIGGRIDFKYGILRPFARAGLTWWSDSDWEQSSQLAAAGSDSQLTTAFEGADVLGIAEIGIDCVLDNGIELRAQYDTNYADDFISHAVSGRVGFRF